MPMAAAAPAVTFPPADNTPRWSSASAVISAVSQLQYAVGRKIERDTRRLGGIAQKSKPSVKVLISAPVRHPSCLRSRPRGDSLQPSLKWFERPKEFRRDCTISKANHHEDDRTVEPVQRPQGWAL